MAKQEIITPPKQMGKSIDMQMKNINGKVEMIVDSGKPAISAAGYFLEIYLNNFSISIPKEIPSFGNTIILDNSGSFNFDLTSGNIGSDSITFNLKSANGLPAEIITNGTISVSAFGKSNNPLVIKAKPYNPMIISSSSNQQLDPNKITIKGKAIYNDGMVIKEKSIILYSKNTTSNTHSPVLNFKTQPDGDFKFQIDNIALNDVFAVVGDGFESKTLICLNSDNKLNSNTILVFEKSLAMETEDCGCHDKTPRLPDSEDLIKGDNKYSQDIGGSCVNFTTPNRSLEEFTFNSILRTTDPRGEYTPMTMAGIADEWDGNINNVIGYKKYLDKTLRQTISKKNQLEWDNVDKAFSVYQALTISHGHVLSYKQVFKADGYSMGDLVYSLPLAPGQKKQIVTFDWNRLDEAKRKETLEAEDTISASISRDRDIDEIISGSLNENTKGGSKGKTSGWAVEGNLQGSVPGVPLSVSVGGGYKSGKSSSDSWQNSAKEMSSSLHNNLKDTTSQSASSLRSQRSTVIASASQNESYSVTTEVVANHNHCHAITMQYFEVLRHFVVEQELVNVQECLFIPLTMSPFDVKKAIRWQQTLKDYLRINPSSKKGKSLLKGFEAINRIDKNYVGFNTPVIPSTSIIKDYYGQIQLNLPLNRPEDMAPAPAMMAILNNNENGSNHLIDPQIIINSMEIVREIDATKWEVYKKYLSKTSIPLIASKFKGKNQEERNSIFDNEIAPEIAEGYIKNLVLSGNSIIINNVVFSSNVKWKRGELMNININFDFINQRNNTSQNIKRSDIGSLSINVPINKNHIDATVNSGWLNYRTESNFQGVLFSNIKGLTTILDPNIGAFCYTPLKPEESFDLKKEDEQLKNSLLEHLNNENLEYYHHAIWYHGINADRRFMMLDRIQLDNPDFTQVYAERGVLGRSIASLVENRVIAFVGNCMVMPVSPGYNLDPTYLLESEDANGNGFTFNSLLEHYQPYTDTDARYKMAYRLSVPTAGLFAEAVQGACNSCEKIDDTRFWRWEESPIDEPTAINPIDTSSRYQSPLDTKAKDFSTPIINIQNTPSAPDPSNMAGVMNLLGQSGTFKDITSSAQTAQNSIDAMKNAGENAKVFADATTKLASMKNSTNNMGKIEDFIDKTWKDNPEKAKELKEKALNSILGIGNEISKPASTIKDGEENLANEETNEVSNEKTEPNQASILSGLLKVYQKTLDDFANEHQKDFTIYLDTLPK